MQKEVIPRRRRGRRDWIEPGRGYIDQFQPCPTEARPAPLRSFLCALCVSAVNLAYYAARTSHQHQRIDSMKPHVSTGFDYESPQFGRCWVAEDRALLGAPDVRPIVRPAADDPLTIPPGFRALQKRNHAETRHGHPS